MEMSFKSRKTRKGKGNYDVIQKKNFGTLMAVRTISVKSFNGDIYSDGINGIKMMDDEGKSVVDIDLAPDIGTWQTEIIPTGQSVVGIKSNMKFGTGLAFICRKL